MSWQDRRTAARARALVDDGHGDLVLARTGLPLDPMFSALKMSWLLDAHDPDRTRARRGELCLGTVDAWLLAKLAPGSDPVTEAGNASRTQLLDIATGAWDYALLQLFDVPAAALPAVVPSTGPFPSVRTLPELEGVPVRAVLGDSHAALFAHAGWRPGVVKATYGTGSSVMALGEADPATRGGICSTIAWHLDGPARAVEANVLSTGRTLTWLAGLFGTDVTTLLAEAEGTAADGVAQPVGERADAGAGQHAVPPSVREPPGEDLEHAVAVGRAVGQGCGDHGQLVPVGEQGGTRRHGSGA